MRKGTGLMSMTGSMHSAIMKLFWKMPAGNRERPLSVDTGKRMALTFMATADTQNLLSI